MGNSTGLVEAMMFAGTNEVKKIKNGYFSMAYGDEIALVYGGDYYILNFDDDLWKITKAKIKEYKGNTKKLIKWWIEMSKKYEISSWSDDFDDLIDVKPTPHQ
jgi:hypothetical protein